MKTAVLALCAAAVLLSGCAYFKAITGASVLGAGVFGEAFQQRAQRGIAQDFATTMFDGRELRLSDFRGQPVVLNFWADWWPPCRAEFPHFQEVYNERAGQFVLLAVAVPRATDPVGYARENGLTLDFAKDTGGAAQLYGVRGIPTTFFIDRRGRIVEQVVGGMDKATFEEKLAGIL